MYRSIFKLLYKPPFFRVISLLSYFASFFSRNSIKIGYYNKVQMKFMPFVRISSSTLITSRNKADIEDYVWVGPYCVLDASNNIKLDEGVQLAYYVCIFTHGSEDSIRILKRDYINYDANCRIGYNRGSVYIGSYTYVGSGAVILPGVRIGKECIIGANCVVHKNIPDYSIVVGSPMKIIGDTRTRKVNK